MTGKLFLKDASFIVSVRLPLRLAYHPKPRCERTYLG